MNVLDLLDPNVAITVGGRTVIMRRGPSAIRDEATGAVRVCVELWTVSAPSLFPDIVTYDRTIVALDAAVIPEPKAPTRTYSVPG